MEVRMDGYAGELTSMVDVMAAIMCQNKLDNDNYQGDTNSLETEILFAEGNRVDILSLQQTKE